MSSQTVAQPADVYQPRGLATAPTGSGSWAAWMALASSSACQCPPDPLDRVEGEVAGESPAGSDDSNRDVIARDRDGKLQVAVVGHDYHATDAARLLASYAVIRLIARS